MSGLPFGWAETTVGSIAESLVDGPFGSNLKSEHYQPSGVRVIRLQNIADGRFDDRDKAYISLAHFRDLSRHEALPGDVLIAAMGEVLPRVCLVPPDIGRAIVKADCFRLRPSQGISASYIAYMLSAPQIREFASTEIAGVGRPRLNLRKVSALPIPIPPSAEQQRIVAAIEEQFSCLDAGVAAMESAERRLLQWLDSAIQAAYASSVNFRPNPESMPLGDLCTRITKGTTPTSVGHKFTSQGIRFIKVESLFEGSVVHEKCAYISEMANADLARSQLHRNDVLVSIAGTLGRIAIVSERDIPANTNQALAIVRLKEPGLAPYVMAWLESPAVRHSLRNEGKGVGMGNLTLEQIRQIPITVPGEEMRSFVLERVDAAKLIVRRAVSDIAKCRRNAEQLRSSVLPAAFSGKLVPQDAAEEPAVALLARVTASAGQMAKRRTSRPRPPREKVTS